MYSAYSSTVASCSVAFSVAIPDVLTRTSWELTLADSSTVVPMRLCVSSRS